MPTLRIARAIAIVVSLWVVPSAVHAQAPGVLSASADAITIPAEPASVIPEPAARPRALLPLYGSFLTLQALDFATTLKAVDSGVGRETNPLLRPVVGSPAALLAVKAGTSAAIIVVSERLRKNRHPVAAVVLMIGVNSAYGIVTAHNFAVLRRGR